MSRYEVQSTKYKVKVQSTKYEVQIANCKVKVQSAKHGNMYRFITCHKGKNQDLRHKRFVTKTNQLYPKSCIVVPLMLN